MNRTRRGGAGPTRASSAEMQECWRGEEKTNKANGTKTNAGREDTSWEAVLRAQRRLGPKWRLADSEAVALGEQVEHLQKAAVY